MSPNASGADRRASADQGRDVGETAGVMFATGPGYEAPAWESFAVAEVGAAAALAGLLVVAASINIARIIELPSVVSRLGGTLALFTGVLAVGTELLVPGVERRLLGAAIAVTGAAVAVILVRLRGVENAQVEYRRPSLVVTVVAVAAALFLAVAGVSYAAGAGGGLYWLAPGVLLAFGSGLVNAWVALVEILR